MLAGYKVVTITHKCAKLEQIGKFVIPHTQREEVKARLLDLKSRFHLEELMYVATCNRVMFAFHARKPLRNDFLPKFFKTVNPALSASDLMQSNEFAQIFQGEDAVRHILSVASSIDSLVIGEREILRQLRDGYDECLEWNLTGDNLRILMDNVVRAAKAVYSDTGIGEKPVSVASLAVQQLIATNLPHNAPILLVGAGQTNRLVATILHKQGYHNFTVFNRTEEKAQELAYQLGGRGYALSQLQQYKGYFAGMIVCTGATEAVIKQDLYEKLLNGDTEKKIIIDLSIPNNVDKAVVTNFNTTYIEIDTLKVLARENMAHREREVSKAQEILEIHFDTFRLAHQQRQLQLAMQHVPLEMRAVKERAKKVFSKQLECLDDETLLLIDQMLNYMEQKCISIPMKAAKKPVVNYEL